MYSTCLFCHAPLGRNEVVENFPVGRRLAYDAEKGRLWVVCRSCERWNLSPLEERWEAIEECERLFRGTRLRVSTEHIGLARLSEGLEVVRVGRPLRPEFAAWRYGDQFGRRRRRGVLRAGLGLGAVGAVLAGGWAVGVTMAGMWWSLFQIGRAAVRGIPDQVVAHVPLPDGERVPIRRKELADVRLYPGAGGHAWSVAVPRRATPYDLAGDFALHAAGLLLPHMNRYGGSAGQVGDAVRFLEDLPHPAESFGQVVERMRRRTGIPEHERYALAKQPAAVRLALEMAAHEDAERKALEGELTLLEQAWKEAEEIAAISDRLLVPSTVERWIQMLRGKP